MQPANSRQSGLTAERATGLASDINFQGATHISAQEIAQMTPDDVARLAQRLEQDEYADAFAGLQDWHLLRAVAFQRSELVEPYLHLLDLEAYDES